MTYSTHLLLALSTLPIAAMRQEVQEILARYCDLILADFLAFQTQQCNAVATLDIERQLHDRLREAGCKLVESLYNRMEGDDPLLLPSHIEGDIGDDHRIVRKKTPHQVDTLFGPITLWRHLYRSVDRNSAEKSIAPLERMLGIVEGTTPALAEAAARYTAAAGSTQRVVQEQLQTRHGVTIGTKRLRALIEHVSANVAEVRQEFQVVQILELLKQAFESKGRTRPSLVSSRDGITLQENQHGHNQVATAATLWVNDRRGKRLGTTYLAFAPELGQHRMTDQLTQLIEEVLRRWEGELPRLAYVTDAGDNETKYYNEVLRPMVHPLTQEPLQWHRIIDFYHVMTRIWILAAVLFGDDAKALRAWARKMGRLLKDRNGPIRVLRSAAALKSLRTLTPLQEEEYRKAYNYLLSRTEWMDYDKYSRLRLPLGSGIVEAACKTIYTQRLKLSGMRWKNAGAQLILNLRVVLLSGIWDAVYRQTLTKHSYVNIRTNSKNAESPLEMAA
jgi:hypothetical protein